MNQRIPIENSEKCFMTEVNTEKRPTGKLWVYGYVRVSLSLQVEGNSVDAQEFAIRKYAEKQGHPIKSIFFDLGCSGKSTEDRLAFNKMMNMIGRSSIVVVANLSRFARSIADAAKAQKELRDKGAYLVMIDLNIDTTSMYGEFLLHNLMGALELERKMIGDRTSKTMLHMSEQGTLVTKPKYGMKQGIRTDPEKAVPNIPNENEIKNIEKILELRTLNPDVTMVQFSVILKENNIKPKEKNSADWAQSSISSFFKQHKDPVGKWGVRNHFKSHIREDD